MKSHRSLRINYIPLIALLAAPASSYAKVPSYGGGRAPTGQCDSSLSPSSALGQVVPGRPLLPRGNAVAIDAPVLRDVQFEDVDPMTGPSACCPPFNEAGIPDLLHPQFQGGAMGPFTLAYTPSSTLDTQMEAYTAYIHALYPGITQLSVKWQIADLGTGATHSWSGPAAAAPQLLNWSATTASPGSFWTGYPLQPNHWYGVRTDITHNGRNQEAPWLEGCTVNQFFVRWIASPARVAAGGQSPGHFEAVSGTGRAIQFGLRLNF